MIGGAATWASISLSGCLGALADDEEPDDPPTPTFVVTDEVVAGAAGIPEGAGGFVAPGRTTRTFVPGMQAVFKVGIWDPETGDIVSDVALDQVIVDLDRGVEVDLIFARSDREWTGDWSIPDDAALGTVEYSVEVTNAAYFTDVGVTANEIEIIEFDPVVTNFVVTADTYATDTHGGGWVQSCLPQHNFTAGMPVGFDIGIYDGGSGEPVGPEVVDEAVVEFETGDPDVMELEWDDEDEHWSATWRGIPEDYEGTLTFEVVVTNDAEFYQVGVHIGSIEIIEEPVEIDEPAS